MTLQWPLILFTFFLCLCGGILGFQGVLTLLGKGKKMQLVSLIAAFIALVIGGISVFTHLQHWERIFNGFSALIMGKGAYGISGIGLELWGCVIFAIVVILYFLFMKRSEDGVAPKWCCVLAILVGIALPAVTGDSYLMAALPAWNTPLLIVYYILNTIAMGSIASLIIARATKCDDYFDIFETLYKIGFIAILVQGVIMLVYAIYITSLGGSWTNIMYYFDPTLPDIHMVDEVGSTNVLLGVRGILFWVGALVVGTIIPLVVLFLASGKKNPFKKAVASAAEGDAVAEAEGEAKDVAKADFKAPIITMVCVVAGGIVWRCVLYMAAISAFALY